MARRDSLPGPAGSLIVRGSFDAYFAVGRDPDLSIRYDPFTGLHALLNHNLIALPLAQSYRSLIDRHVRLDDVDVSTFRRHLRGGGRHQYGAANRVQDQTNVDEAPGPEPSIGI